MRQVGLFIAWVGACALALAAPNFPPLTGRVVDAAGILSASTRVDLTAQLEAYERSSGNQIVVATIKDLGGLDIADYGYQLGRQWGIGNKERNTGALLIVAATEHKVRIEVGYGLEGDLTDAMSANIIQTQILPAFRKGNFDAGVRAGVDGIIATLGGEGDARGAAEPVRNPRHAVPGAIFWLIVLFIVLNSGRRGGGGIARALFWGSVLNGMSGRGGRHGGFGGGFGGGGGGFRGGGGSFGGGGASGGW